MKYIFTLLAVFYTYVLAGEFTLIMHILINLLQSFEEVLVKLCSFCCTESISIFLAEIA